MAWPLDGHGTCCIPNKVWSMQELSQSWSKLRRPTRWLHRDDNLSIGDLSRWFWMLAPAVGYYSIWKAEGTILPPRRCEGHPQNRWRRGGVGRKEWDMFRFESSSPGRLQQVRLPQAPLLTHPARSMTKSITGHHGAISQAVSSRTWRHLALGCEKDTQCL